MREYVIASDENMEKIDRDPDSKIPIPGVGPTSGEANELHIWYTEDQTIVWGSGQYDGQEYYVTQGRVSPEDCLMDYFEQEAKAFPSSWNREDKPDDTYVFPENIRNVGIANEIRVWHRDNYTIIQLVGSIFDHTWSWPDFKSAKELAQQFIDDHAEFYEERLAKAGEIVW